MKNLGGYCLNIFANSRVGDAKFRMFCEFHLQGLINNNPGGIYDTIIALLSSAYMNYYGALEDEATKLAIREGKTVAMKDSRKKVSGFISRQEGLVRSKWGKDSAEYQEFYPQGVSVYLLASLGDFAIMLERYKNSVTAHAAELGAAFVTEATTLIENFLSIRSSQINLMAIVSGKRTASSISREALEMQVMENLLFIASKNVGKPEKISAYFDQSIIRLAVKKIRRGKVAVNSTKKILMHTFRADEMLTFKNKGNVELVFGMCEDSLQTVINGISVPSGDSKRVTAKELGDLNHKYLNVTNIGAVAAGAYEVELQ